MTGDDEDPIGMADTDAVHIKVEEEEKSKKSTKAPPKKKPWSKMRKVTVIVFVLFLIIVIPIAATLQMPSVNVVGVEIQVSGAGLQKTYTLNAIVQVDNPNIVGVTVTHISGDFYINGDLGGNFVKTDSVTIIALGNTQFPIEVKITNVVPIHLNADNAVRVKGTVTVQGAASTNDIPFDVTQIVHVP